MAFIFGGGTGETAASIARKREIAKALMPRGRAPQNIGEGLASAGGDIVSALMRRSADRAEAAGQTEANAAFDSLFSAPSGGGMPEAAAVIPGQGPATPESFISGAEPAGQSATAAPGGDEALARAFADQAGPVAKPSPDIAAALSRQPPTAGAAGDLAHGGPALADLLKVSGNEFLPPARQKILAALIGQRMNPAERRIIKGADGYNYFADSGERALPNVEAAPEDPLSSTGKMLADLERFEPGSPQHEAIQARLRKDSYIAPVRPPNPGAATNAKAETIMRELGVDRQTAYRVATGVYRTSRDPVTGNAHVIDLTTGALVGQPGAGGGDAAATEQFPEGGMSMAPEGGPKIRLDDAYGATSSAAELWNNIGGQLSDDQINPDVAQARTAAKLALGSFQRAFAKNPRLPVYEQQRLADLFPKPDAFTSAGSARVALRTIRDELDAYRQDKQRIVADGNLPAKQRQEAASALATYDELGSALDRFDIDDNGDAPEGVSEPKTAAEYEALPPGAIWRDADGNLMQKGEK